jgi:cytosine/creatinine deaminase
MMKRLFANLRGPTGADVDILVQDGMIAAMDTHLTPRLLDADVVDGQGALALPGLVDGHIHLDKTLAGLPWTPHPAGPERSSRIETEKALRGEWPLSVAERAAHLLRQCIALGTTALRTHVDIDPDIGLAHLHAILRVKEQFKDQVDLQIVAFPQSGVVRCPGTADLLDMAIAEGADLLGGIDPLTMDGDLDGQLDTLFAIASRRGVGLDVHLHDPGPQGLIEIATLAERAKACGMEGQATVSHGFSLGAAEDADFDRTGDLMAASGVSLVTHGGGASPLPPVKRLRSKGVCVFAGNDNVRDTWSPYGNGDLLERAMLLAWRSGFRTDEDLAVAFDTISGAGAQALGLDDYGLEVGKRADFVCVQAETLAEAVVSHSHRSLVVKRGEIVTQDGAWKLG